MQPMFGTGILFATQLLDATGASVSNPTPVQFGALQEVQSDFSFEVKKLYGAYQFPIAVGRGKGVCDFSCKVASINGSIFGDLFTGNSSSAGIKAVVANFAAAVPASTPWQVTITPPGSGTWLNDMGVVNASTGLALKRVASSPTTGQYSVAAGVYTFASADANMNVYISYEYSATSTTAKVMTLTNNLMGYAPTFKAALPVSYGGKLMTMVLNNCMSTKLTMPLKNDDFMISDFQFSAMADSSGLTLGYLATTE